MLKSSNKQLVSEGFLLVEIVLAVAVFGMLSFIVLSAFIYGRDSVTTSGDNIRGSEIANEAVEALYNIAQSSYSNLNGYANGTVYYLNASTAQWSLSTAPQTINSIYTPSVVFSNGPTMNSRQAVVTITWQENLYRQGKVTATTYFANWQAATTQPIKTGLLVYANGGTTTQLIDYRLLQTDGSWTNPVALPQVTPSNKVARSVKLYPAQTGAQKVVMARFFDGNSQYIYGFVWDGNNWGNVQLLGQFQSAAALDIGNYSGAYMANGTFVAVYSDNTNIPKYRTWNGTTWSTQGSLPQISNDSSDSPTSMNVLARPGANEVMTAMLGNDYETVTSLYANNTWSAMTTHATNGTSNSTKMVDFAWSPVNSADGALVFSDSNPDQKLSFRIFTDTGGAGTWGSIMRSSPQPSGSDPITLDITAQPTGTEDWVVCDKDYLNSQTIFCYTLTPTTSTNPINQVIAQNSNNGGQQSFNVGFERSNGNIGLNAYSDNTANGKIKKFTSSTNTWDPSPLAIPSAASAIYKTRLVPEPGKSDAMILEIDSQNNLYSIMFNGTASNLYTTPAGYAWTIHNANGPSVGAKWFDFGWDN